MSKFTFILLEQEQIYLISVRNAFRKGKSDNQYQSQNTGINMSVYQQTLVKLASLNFYQNFILNYFKFKDVSNPLSTTQTSLSHIQNAATNTHQLTFIQGRSAKIANQLHLATFWGKKRANSSNVWDHFGFKTDSMGVILDKTKAVCRHCFIEVKYRGGSTTNLTSHFNNHHMQKSKDVAKSTQPSIQAAFVST